MRGAVDGHRTIGRGGTAWVHVAPSPTEFCRLVIRAPKHTASDFLASYMEVNMPILPFVLCQPYMKYYGNNKVYYMQASMQDS